MDKQKWYDLQRYTEPVPSQKVLAEIFKLRNDFQKNDGEVRGYLPTNADPVGKPYIKNLYLEMNDKTYKKFDIYTYDDISIINNNSFPDVINLLNATIKLSNNILPENNKNVALYNKIPKMPYLNPQLNSNRPSNIMHYDAKFT